MFGKIIAAVIVLVLGIFLLSVPGYSNPRQGDEKAVRAYNSHNLYYAGDIDFFE